MGAGGGGASIASWLVGPRVRAAAASPLFVGGSSRRSLLPRSPPPASSLLVVRVPSPSRPACAAVLVPRAAVLRAAPASIAQHLPWVRGVTCRIAHWCHSLTPTPRSGPAATDSWHQRRAQMARDYDRIWREQRTHAVHYHFQAPLTDSGTDGDPPRTTHPGGVVRYRRHSHARYARMPARTQAHQTAANPLASSSRSEPCGPIPEPLCPTSWARGAPRDSCNRDRSATPRLPPAPARARPHQPPPPPPPSSAVAQEPRSQRRQCCGRSRSPKHNSP